MKPMIEAGFSKWQKAGLRSRLFISNLTKKFSYTTNTTQTKLNPNILIGAR